MSLYPFELQQIVRFGQGELDLMRITRIDNTMAIPYYYGVTPTGEARSASAAQCTAATAEKRAFDKKPAKKPTAAQNIKECADIAKRNDAQAVVVMRIERDGVITLSTYGENAHKCRVIGDWAQKSIGANYPRIPFEPVFGWGNGGVPKLLEMREYMGLTPGGKAYYDSLLKGRERIRSEV